MSTRGDSYEICALDIRAALEFGALGLFEIQLTSDRFTPDYDPAWGW